MVAGGDGVGAACGCHRQELLLGDTDGADTEFINPRLTSEEFASREALGETQHCRVERVELRGKLLDGVDGGGDERTILQREVAVRAGADGFGNRALHILRGETGILCARIESGKRVPVIADRREC